MKDSLQKSSLAKTIFIPILFALPLLYAPILKITVFMYIAIFNGGIFRMFNPHYIQPIFYANALWECITISLIAVYALIIRLVCGIDSSIKKVLFALFLIFYLLPHQAILISICITILQSTDIIEWDLLKTWTSILYMMNLVMSLCIYRIIVSRKNSKIKITLACMTNFILVIASIVPFTTETNINFVYIAFALMLVWIATLADVVYEGIGYKIIEKLLFKINHFHAVK